MFEQIWFTFLYQPLFNALILIYNSIAGQNLGWAVIWLTIFLRIFLLPLSIISEKRNIKKEKVEEQARKSAEAFRGDSIAMKEEFRKIVKKNKISPWAKVAVLLIQVLVFVLLYEVFIQGINGARVIKVLYSAVDYPGNINLNFYGFNVGNTHVVFWAFLAAAYLMLAIFFEHGLKNKWLPSEAAFLILFPLFTFLLLWYLPMVKSLFILTTMMFSTILALFGKLFKSSAETTEISVKK